MQAKEKSYIAVYTHALIAIKLNAKKRNVELVNATGLMASVCPS